MSPIANEPRNVKHGGPSLAPQRSSYPVGSAHLEGQGKLHLVRERWSEFSSLLTSDFWTDFLLVYICLTAGVVCIWGMLFGITR